MEQKETNWINAKTNFPIDEEEVLVVCKTSTGVVYGIGWYSEEYKTWCSDDENIKTDDIEAWMYIPEYNL